MPNTSRPLTWTITSVSPVMFRCRLLAAVCTGVTSAVIVIGLGHDAGRQRQLAEIAGFAAVQRNVWNGDLLEAFHLHVDGVAAWRE